MPPRQRERHLAAAADEALDAAASGDQEPITGMPPAWRAKFNGVSMDSMDEAIPELGDSGRFIVEGHVVKRLRELRKDGERRETVVFEVTKVIPADHVEQPAAPAGDEG